VTPQEHIARSKYARARRAVRASRYLGDRVGEIIATTAAIEARREIRAAQRDRAAA